MNMVDDATSKSYGLFDTGETTYIALRSLYEWNKEIWDSKSHLQ